MALSDIFAVTYFGNTIQQFLIFFAFISGSILAGKVLYYLSTGIVRKITAKTTTKFDDILIDMLEEPLVFLVFILGFYLGYQHLTLTEGAMLIFEEIAKIMLTLAGSWFILRFLDSMIVNYLIPLAQKTESDLDDHIIPLIRNLVKITIIAITVIMVIDNLGYNGTSVLAGLGIGGLAFALAAQDLLKNLFGGITIITDKPFRLGQWVDIGGQQGEVMEIGMRSTRLKTLTGEFVTIPNSFIAEKATINYKTYQEKTIVFTVGLVYGTSTKKLKTAKDILHKVLASEEMVLKDTIQVNFLSFGAYSLDVETRYKVNTNDAAMIRRLKDKVNMQIKEQFEKAKIEFAFPTQTVVVAR